MIYPKEKFESFIDETQKKYQNKHFDPFLKDLSDCLIFSCVYGGKNEVKYETKYINNTLNQKINVNEYSLNSYDMVYTLTFAVKDDYFRIEKIDDYGNYRYLVEYFIDKDGNYQRKAQLKNQQIGKKQDIEETLFGTFDSGAYFVETFEKNSNLKVCCFKLPNFEKTGENVYIKYDSNNQPIMYKAKSSSKIPFLESLGMNTLSILLSEQFEEEGPITIDNNLFFDKLLQTSKLYYTQKKPSAK